MRKQNAALCSALAMPSLARHVADKVDAAMATNERGIWALKVSLVGLGATALFQVVIVLLSSSTALLADTIHNFGDAARSVPL